MSNIIGFQLWMLLQLLLCRLWSCFISEQMHFMIWWFRLCLHAKLLGDTQRVNPKFYDISFGFFSPLNKTFRIWMRYCFQTKHSLKFVTRKRDDDTNLSQLILFSLHESKNCTMNQWKHLILLKCSYCWDAAEPSGIPSRIAPRLVWAYCEVNKQGNSQFRRTTPKLPQLLLLQYV